jgi:hypothetical protein
MRSAYSASSKKIEGFMDGLPVLLPREKIGLVLADRGFSGNIAYLEGK